MSTTLHFSQCTLPLLDKAFGLRNVMELAALTDWFQRSTEVPLSELDLNKLVDLQDLLQVNANSWNEQELSLHFIGPIFSIVKFTDPYRYNLFAQRHIEANVDDYLLKGEPDGLIASGYYEPEIPYFAFAEYKRQRDPNGDPAGQALAAMLVSQRLNPKPDPVYGCYVIGRDWFLWPYKKSTMESPMVITPCRSQNLPIFCASSKDLKRLSVTS